MISENQHKDMEEIEDFNKKEQCFTNYLVPKMGYSKKGGKTNDKRSSLLPS